MTQKEFEENIKQLIPSLTALVNTVKKTRYFGYYDASDLLQEVLMRLYVKVPTNYDESKGSLKCFCLKTAANYINKIGKQIHKNSSEVQTDWNHITDDDATFTPREEIVHRSFYRRTTPPTVNPILFRMHLESLSTVNKDFKILHTHYENGSDPKATCKELGMCRSSLNNVFTRVRSHRLGATLATDTNREALKKRLSDLSSLGLYIGMNNEA